VRRASLTTSPNLEHINEIAEGIEDCKEQSVDSAKLVQEEDIISNLPPIYENMKSLPPTASSTRQMRHVRLKRAASGDNTSRRKST